MMLALHVLRPLGRVVVAQGLVQVNRALLRTAPGISAAILGRAAPETRMLGLLSRHGRQTGSSYSSAKGGTFFGFTFPTAAAAVFRASALSSIHRRLFLDAFGALSGVLQRLAPIRFRLLGTSVLASAVAAVKNDDRRGRLRHADSLYDAQKFEELVDYLSMLKDDKDPEILWRLARALYESSKQQKEPDRQKTVAAALEQAEAANAIDPENFAIHKWLSILVDALSNYGGLKQRITESKRVQFHMKKACELKPTDGTSWHLLGLWCFTVADIPWYQRKVASTFVATPPESTFDEALSYFLKAEEVEPNFYSMNYLFIGKCYVKLGNRDLARKFLEQAAAYKVVTDDDRKAVKEAVELLKKL